MDSDGFRWNSGIPVNSCGIRRNLWRNKKYCLNAEATAVNTLEGTSYFQGKRSVDDYLDQFQDLVEDSGYTDKKTLVVKFRRGLDRRIASAIGAMATGRPSDTNPEGWYSLAVQLD